MRRFLRAAKSVLVLAIVFMMTIDTANACRLFHRIFARDTCCTEVVADCETATVQPDCHVEVVEEKIVWSSGEVVSADCECSGEVVTGTFEPATSVAPAEEVIMDATPMDIEPAESVLAPAEIVS